MGRQGFVDANGYEVTVGTYVEYADHRFARVIDLTQDGDVTIECLDGERLMTKWRMVARLDKEIATQLEAMTQRLDSVLLRSNPGHLAGKVEGYTAQPDAKVALVNGFKQDEERLLRKIENLIDTSAYFEDAAVGGVVIANQTVRHRYDVRALALARTELQTAFMWLNRAIFQPQRIKLPEDGE